MSAFKPQRFGACGKIILLGEHAVVYGHPALAGALSTGVSIDAIPGRGRLIVADWNLTLEPSGPTDIPLGLAYQALRARLAAPATSPMDFYAHFAIPTGAGLGSSAALAVALARAVVAVHQIPSSNDLLSDAAMASEQIIHGQPSGLDHTVSLLGGFGLFRKATGLTQIAAAKPISLLIGHTGRARDTKGRVARIAELYRDKSREVRERFAAISELVQQGCSAVESGDALKLGQAFLANQTHLAALEVSCPEIDHLCLLAIEGGALGAKLTGGGGGGCVIALAPGRIQEVQQLWSRAGFNSFVTEVGGAIDLRPMPAASAERDLHLDEARS